MPRLVGRIGGGLREAVWLKLPVQLRAVRTALRSAAAFGLTSPGHLDSGQYPQMVDSAGVTSGETVEYDVFISHAHEDKNDFVRDLARALEARRLRPWYDEFTLRPGDSVRRSIDHGLLTSQAAILILSEAFFAKRWTTYELDGIVELYAGSPDQIAAHGRRARIIPVWHGVDASSVARHSPSLANLVALNSRDGVEAVADGVLRALRPAGSTLLFAHAVLVTLGEPHGWRPPVITDDWWLDAAEASAVRQATDWGHWGFPLPTQSPEPQQRGERMAWAAAQMMWQRAATRGQLSQITPPDEVHGFIKNWPGLLQACIRNPAYCLTYAPQLALHQLGGPVQDVVDDLYRNARSNFEAPTWPESVRKLAAMHRYLVLRHVDLIRADRVGAARYWIEGDPLGPRAQIYEIVDYAGWLASTASDWMGSEKQRELIAGIRRWGAWIGWQTTPVFPGKLSKLAGVLEWGELTDRSRRQIRAALTARLSHTAERLRLPEDGQTLAAHLDEAGLIQGYPHSLHGDALLRKARGSTRN